MNLGDIFFRALIRVDPEEIRRSATEAGGEIDKAGLEKKGSTIGDIFSGKVATGFKIAGAAATLGFGLMTAGSLQMEDAQGKFIAQTGRSREEAVAFSKDMNGIVGTANTVNRSFEEIAGAGATVAQQFGLTGKANADLTEDFLGFSKVTGQDATVAINDFDAALDAWHEPAERANGLMDQLIASNQRYGTDAGPAALDALTKMAPALQQMGKDLDYGVGLLNLFESAGIDSSVAQKALNTAVAQLPPGSSFDDIIAKAGAVADPLDRGAMLAEIFGDKIGRQLANAITPGMTSLDDFIVTQEEVAGKTDDASAALLTMRDKVQIFADQAGAKFREFGSAFGPALSGLATLGSGLGTLASTLKLDGFIDTIKGKLGDALKTAWTGATTLAQKAVDLAAGAASAAYGVAVKVGQAVGDALSAGWDVAKGLASKAVDLAGKAASAAYAAAAFVGERLAEAAETAWGFVAGAVEGAVKRAGGVIGKLFGDSLTDNIVTTTVGAAGTIIGNLSADLIKAVTLSWDKVTAWIKQGATGGVIAKAGILSGAIYGGAVAVFDKLVELLSLGWGKVTGNLRVLGAAGTAGVATGTAYAAATAGPQVIMTAEQKAIALVTASLGGKGAGGAAALAGTTMGTAAAAGMAGPAALQQATTSGKLLGAAMGIGLVLAVALIAEETKDELAAAGAGMRKSVMDGIGVTPEAEAKGLLSDTIFDSIFDNVHVAAARLSQVGFGLDSMQHDIHVSLQDIWIAATEQQLDPAPMQKAFEDALAKGMSVADAKAIGLAAGGAAATGVRDGLANYVPEAAREGWRAATPAVVQGAVAMTVESARAMQEHGRREYGAAGTATAQAFGRTMTSEGRSEMERVRNLYVAETQRTGKAAAQALAGGLLSSLPTMHDAWDAYKTQAKNMLDPLKEITWIQARLAGGKLAAGLESTNPLQRAASQLMQDTLMSRLEELQRLMGNAGEEGGDSLGSSAVRALRAWQAEWFRELHKMAQTAETLLKTHSPAKAGPWSKDGGPEGWFRSMGRRMRTALQEELSRAISPPGFGQMPGLGLPQMAFAGGPSASLTQAITQSSTVSSRRSVDVNVNVALKDPDGLAGRIGYTREDAQRDVQSGASAFAWQLEHAMSAVDSG